MSDSELSPIDELAEMDDRTNGDGTVSVTIENWEKISDNSVDVEFELVDSVKRERMDWPDPGDGLEDTKFYRLVRSAGLSIRNAELLEGKEATARKVDGNWILHVPENTTRVDKVTSGVRTWFGALISVDWIRVVIAAFWVISVLFILSLAVVAL